MEIIFGNIGNMYTQIKTFLKNVLLGVISIMYKYFIYINIYVYNIDEIPIIKCVHVQTLK